jgi:hypothetical protein
MHVLKALIVGRGSTGWNLIETIVQAGSFGLANWNFFKALDEWRGQNQIVKRSEARQRLNDEMERIAEESDTTYTPTDIDFHSEVIAERPDIRFDPGEPKLRRRTRRRKRTRRAVKEITEDAPGESNSPCLMTF